MQRRTTFTNSRYNLNLHVGVWLTMGLHSIVHAMNGEIAVEHVLELMMDFLNFGFEGQHLTRINFKC